MKTFETGALALATLLALAAPVSAATRMLMPGERYYQFVNATAVPLCIVENENDPSRVRSGVMAEKRSDGSFYCVDRTPRAP